MGSANSAIELAITANATIAGCQPKLLISDCPKGASTIVPSEPEAATSPTVWLRLASGVARVTTPISTPKAVPAVPMPSRKPAMSRPSSPRENTISSMRTNTAARW